LPVFAFTLADKSNGPMSFWQLCCVLVDEHAAHSWLTEFDIVQYHWSVKSKTRVGYVRWTNDIQSSSKRPRRSTWWTSICHL